jgi:hypothetical protein
MGSAIWTASSFDKLLNVMPISVIPRSSIIGRASASRARPAVNNVTVCVVDSWSVRPGRPGEIVRTGQAERDRSGDAVRAARAARAGRRRDQVDVELVGRSGAPAERPLGADGVTPPADLDGAWVAVVRQRVQAAARGAAEDRDQRVFVEPGDVGDRREGRSRASST